MKLSSLTLILTDKCNWRCTYCYQKRRPLTMDGAVLAEACDYFRPRLESNALISFYGGEPLLAFGRLKTAVEHLLARRGYDRRRLRFSITTNGSLITDDILDYLDQREFEVVLSFDGLAQDKGRKAGSYRSVRALIEKLLGRRRLSLATNSVFTPRTVGLLSRSLGHIAELGVANILWTLSAGSSWTTNAEARLDQELRHLRDWLLKLYRRTGSIPVADFRPEARLGVLACSAGRDRLALAPDGTVWGCYMFADWARSGASGRMADDFNFGSFSRFIKSGKDIIPSQLKRWERLRMDACHTDRELCALCPHLSDCSFCPVSAALPGEDLGHIPTTWCRMSRWLSRERRKFWKMAGITAPSGGSARAELR